MPMPIPDSEAFRRGLLLYLACSDTWTPLTEAMEKGKAFACTRYDRDISVAYSTLKRTKANLLRDGLIEQSREGQHFVLQLTELGRTRASGVEALDGEDDEALTTELPGAPFRLGRDHTLPPPVWKELIASVRNGDLDLIVIPRETKTKIGYWE